VSLTLGLRIADRYVTRELLGPFFLGVGGFIVVLAGDILYTLAEFLATGQIRLGVLLALLAYKLPAILVVTFPVSTLFAILLGVGRLARDREVQAFRLAGRSLTRIFLPVLLFAAVMAGAGFATNEFFAPWANQRANALLRRAAFGEAGPPIRQQVFFRDSGDRVFYVEQVDSSRKTLRNVMIYDASRPLPRVITAREASWEPSREAFAEPSLWRLRDGVVRELDEQGFTRFETRFASLDLAVAVEEATLTGDERRPDEMTARELQSRLRLFSPGDLPPRLAMEFHRRFAVPLTSVVFALLAAPLSLHVAQGRFLSIGISIVLLFIYYAVMSIGRALGATGAVTPALAAWLPNLLFSLGGLTMWARVEGGWPRPLLPIAALRKLVR
jgi:lipopolysaccharide export system permease protein